MLEYILLFLFLFIIYLFFKFVYPSFNKREILNNDQPIQQSTFYIKKKLMTDSEQKFYNNLTSLNDKYAIIPQVCLASIITKKSNSRYSNDLYRIVDFAIFNKDLSEVLLLIELNDLTHNEYQRKDRDLKVKKICSDAEIPLMTFHTKYPNEQDYVLKRILNQIEKDSLPISTEY